MDNNEVNVVGLQIGGAVGQNDRVGMHIEMPNQPGIGVSVNINDAQLAENLNFISSNISDEEPKSAEIKRIVEEIVAEKNEGSKLLKIKYLIDISSGITTIALSVFRIKQILGL